MNVHKSSHAASLLVVSCLLVAGAHAGFGEKSTEEKKAEKKPDDSKRVAENLQGEWQMIRADFGAEPAPPNTEMGLPKMVIKGNMLVMLPPGKDAHEATFTLNLDKKPYAINMRPKSKKDEVAKGIFEFKDGELHLTYGRPGLDRPTQLNPPPEARYYTLVFQRAAKK